MSAESEEEALRACLQIERRLARKRGLADTATSQCKWPRLAIARPMFVDLTGDDAAHDAAFIQCSPTQPFINYQYKQLTVRGYTLPPLCWGNIATYGGVMGILVVGTASLALFDAVLRYAYAELEEWRVCGECSAVERIDEGSHCPRCGQEMLTVEPWSAWTSGERLRLVCVAMDALLRRRARPGVRALLRRRR